MRKLSVIFVSLLLISSLWGNLIRHAPVTGPGKRATRCSYIGKLKQMLKYHKGARGAVIDDGIFVAVPDGGIYGGYTYYELAFRHVGGKDGGPAYLPLDPGSFAQKKPPKVYHETKGHHPDRDGFFKTWGFNINHIHGRHVKENVPELPDGAILPPGTLFFHWISGGGSYNLGFSVLEPLKYENLVIRAYTIPMTTQERIWFLPSDIAEARYQVYDMAKEKYNNQWRKYYR